MDKYNQNNDFLNKLDNDDLNLSYIRNNIKNMMNIGIEWLTFSMDEHELFDKSHDENDKKKIMSRINDNKFKKYVIPSKKLEIYNGTNRLFFALDAFSYQILVILNDVRYIIYYTVDNNINQRKNIISKWYKVDLNGITNTLDLFDKNTSNNYLHNIAKYINDNSCKLSKKNVCSPIIAILGKARLYWKSEILILKKMVYDVVIHVKNICEETIFLTGGYSGRKDNAYGTVRIGYDIPKEKNFKTMAIFPRVADDIHIGADAKGIYGFNWGEDTPALAFFSDIGIMFGIFGAWSEIELLYFSKLNRPICIYFDYILYKNIFDNKNDFEIELKKYNFNTIEEIGKYIVKGDGYIYEIPVFFNISKVNDFIKKYTNIYNNNNYVEKCNNIDKIINNAKEKMFDDQGNVQIYNILKKGISNTKYDEQKNTWIPVGGDKKHMKLLYYKIY
jgi:hypothetical protein